MRLLAISVTHNHDAKVKNFADGFAKLSGRFLYLLCHLD